MRARKSGVFPPAVIQVVAKPGRLERLRALAPARHEAARLDWLGDWRRSSPDQRAVANMVFPGPPDG